ncbi:hypothetical protein [Seonamhaeicola sp.]|uniref:hypothetical protein n=1 Tax=Seonamhaeicola sp. TaxID=1912245 RepID=UPI00356868CB
MNGYELSRKWFDFCFDNPEKIKPNHTAIYFFAIEHCNRLGWKKKFGLPTSMTMEAIGIKSYNTYKEALFEIVEWGFINMIQKSKNQYSSNIIALSNFDKAHNKAHNKALDKALDKALIKHTSKQSESIDSINKPINKEQINNKPDVVVEKNINNIEAEFDKTVFRDIEELRNHYLTDLRLRNAFCESNKFDNSKIPERLKQFNIELAGQSRFKETFNEYAKYFLAWHRKAPLTATIEKKKFTAQFNSPVL